MFISDKIIDKYILIVIFLNYIKRYYILYIPIAVSDYFIDLVESETSFDLIFRKNEKYHENVTNGVCTLIKFYIV